MNKTLHTLLLEIEKKPTAYIGEYSLKTLASFLSGYIYCKQELDENYCDDFYGFQPYIQKKYGVHTSEKWSTVICRFSTSEEEAFATFYKLVHAFYDSINA